MNNTYYLKCINCGNLSEVKSEYLTFCSTCGKKLDTNFRDWQQKNPNQTLDDFKTRICITNNDIPDKTKQKKWVVPSFLIYWLAFVAFMSGLYLAGNLVDVSLLSFLNPDKTPLEILGEQWVSETYGNYGLNVETPVKMTRTELQLPDNLRGVIDEMDTYGYQSSKVFYIIINSIKYKPVIGSINLQGAANGSVNKVRIEKGVTNFKYTEEHVLQGEIQGFLQKGSYKQNNTDIAFINAGYGEGLHLWQVSVGYLLNDNPGEKIAERIIQSIIIDTTKSIQNNEN